MKTLIQLFVSILLTGFVMITAKSQTYVPFPSDGMIWNIITVNDLFNPHDAYKLRYGLVGDTLINDTLYSKMYVLRDDTLLNVDHGTYAGGIREDANKRVFYRGIDFPDKEFLIYDFSLQVGDTIHYNCLVWMDNMSQQEEISYGIVDSIDSVFINDGYRKRYIFQSGDIWIEGMGSIRGYGFFHPIAIYLLCGDEVIAACIKHDETVLYQENPLCNGCFCALAAIDDEFDGEKHRVTVFPNPTKMVLNIEFNPYENENYELLLLDLTGKEVFSKTNIKSGAYQLDRKWIETGFYLVVIKGNKGSLFSEKIFIE